jgi:hypothetical protein
VVAEIEALGTGRTRGDGGSRRVDDAFIIDKEPPPTMSEKRFVKVGWPSTGGFWVAEFDTTWVSVDEEDNLYFGDEGPALLRMARTMDERCTLMKDRFQPKFYEYLNDYKGYTFLNSWETKDTGEVGPLLHPEETVRLWTAAYCSFGLLK